jgi:PhnB protein
MTQINGYISFNGNCREAMTFYKDCLGGELTLQAIGESPIAGQCPSAMQNQILHSMLIHNGIRIMGSDMEGAGGVQQGNNISLMINCSSEEEINRFFSSLSEGGKVLDPLKVQFWGGTFGVINDKFGIRWMFNYDKNAQNN